MGWFDRDIEDMDGFEVDMHNISTYASSTVVDANYKGKLIRLGSCGPVVQPDKIRFRDEEDATD